MTDVGVVHGIGALASGYLTLVYGTLAWIAAKRFHLPLPSSFDLALRAGTATFLLACGIMHGDAAFHLIVTPELTPVLGSPHMVALYVLQSIGATVAAVLIALSSRYVVIRVAPRKNPDEPFAAPAKDCTPA